MNLPQPDAFLTVRVHNLEVAPSLSGLCVGYERGEWRSEALASHLMDWLPEFALSSAEYSSMGHQNATKLIRSAAKRVYDTGKFRNRGEFGEMLLHAAIRQTFNSYPAVSKIYYKSANNDTVKGFDAVQAVEAGDDLELWLGEAKFYDNIPRAISDVVVELHKHTQTDYLRNEFALIVNKIDTGWRHASALQRLLQPEVSLDQVFQRVCIPVLLTYDSGCVNQHSASDANYVKAFEAEIGKNYEAFKNKNLPKDLRIHLYLVPLKSKALLVEALDKKLKAWQQI